MSGEIEKRFSAVEFRAADDGSHVEGVALRYGDLARLGPKLQERFTPGAFGDLAGADAILNLYHNPDRPLARSDAGLVLTDSPETLRVRGELPTTTDGRDAKELLARRVLRGFSIEFVARDEQFIDDEGPGVIREVTRAELHGVALVARGAYGDSLAALATRAAKFIEASKPPGRGRRWY